jgi:peptidyl-tRNA hydrolase, PTH1 family
VKVVVGLGNPGAQYQQTRHNVGFDVLDVLRLRWMADPPRRRFEADVCETVRHGEKTLLIAPLTFMNLSGRSVQQVLKFFQVPPSDCLVVCDDLNLPLGQIRLRGKGSAGGQKGLAHILQVLATDEVPRLRLGIDRPGPGGDVVSFVLARFRKDEQPVIDDAVQLAASAVEAWIERGLAAAMNEFNAAAGG